MAGLWDHRGSREPPLPAPHWGPHLPPRGPGYKVEGQEQPPLYRGKMTLVSVSLSEEAVPACWASQLPGDQLGWSTARGMRRGTGPSQGGWDQDTAQSWSHTRSTALWHRAAETPGEPATTVGTLTLPCFHGV